MENKKRLFRGKTIDKKEWIYGDGGEIEGRYVIKNGKDFLDIEQETFSEYTGFNDKNGNKIFLGDIIEVNNCLDGINGLFCAVAPYSLPCVKKIGYDEHPPVPILDLQIEPDLTIDNKTTFLENSIIVGNRFDNPELLGGTE